MTNVNGNAKTGNTASKASMVNGKNPSATHNVSSSISLSDKAPYAHIPNEYVPIKDILDIIRKDAKDVTTAYKQYCEQNMFQYYTSINTWMLLIQELMGDRAAFSVKMSIQRDGLLKTIGNASDLADQVIRYTVDGTPITVPYGWFMPEIADMNLDEVLQCLRYLKRFTPTSADLLLNESFEKFLAINRRCREQDFCELPIWITSRVKFHTSAMLKYFRKEYDKCFPRFSSGSTTMGKALINKLKGYTMQQKYWMHPLYPMGDPTTIESPDPTVTIIGVPKNYKGYRLIGPEHPYYAAEKQRIMEAMRRSIARTRYGQMYTPDDQTPNQNLAREGAIDGSYATIDLTSASDSISKRLAVEVLPDDFIEVVKKFEVTTVIVGKRTIIKRMFATSGDPVCFDTESVIFLAIALTVKEMCEGLCGEKFRSPRVFGDDLVVDGALFDSVMDILSILGFIPNRTKSFGAKEGGYRESCGVEYYFGMDTSTRYWPRRVVLDPKDDPSALEAMIQLEHRLYHNWSVTRFMIEVVTRCYPKITASLPGTECTDLWADAPWCPVRCAPVDRDAFDRESIPQEWTRREVHTTFVTEIPVNKGIKLDLEMYYYVDFLRNGPLYASPLDELLRISSPRSRAADFANAKLVVTQKTT